MQTTLLYEYLLDKGPQRGVPSPSPMPCRAARCRSRPGCLCHNTASLASLKSVCTLDIDGVNSENATGPGEPPPPSESTGDAPGGRDLLWSQVQLGAPLPHHRGWALQTPVPSEAGQAAHGCGQGGAGVPGGAVGETPASWGELMSSCSMGSRSLQVLIYGNNVLSYLTCFPG